jgi:hypothetical protein
MTLKERGETSTGGKLVIACEPLQAVFRTKRTLTLTSYKHNGGKR